MISAKAKRFFARCALETHLFPVMQTFIVVLECGYTLLRARDIVGIGIYNVAG